LFHREPSKPTERETDFLTFFRFGWPIIALIVMMGCAGLFLLADLTRSQDRAFAINSQRLVQQGINGVIETNAVYSTDYALWDDGYESVTLNYDPEWLKSNYNPTNSASIGVYREGQGLRHIYIKKGMESMRADIEAFASTLNLAAHRPYLLSRDPARVVIAPSGLEVIDGKLAVIAVQPIRPEPDSDLLKSFPNAPQDYIIFINFIDAAKAAKIGEASGLKAPELHVSDVAQPLREGRVGLDLTNSAGKLIARIDWHDEKPGSAAFASRFLPIGLALLLVGTLTLVVTNSLCERQVQLSESARLAAEEASHQKSSFLANVSHELRTPLNAIIGYSEILAEDCLDAKNDIGLGDARKVTRAAHHLLALINDLLDHSKIEAGKLDFNPAQVGVSPILEEVVDALRPHAQERGNQLLLNCDPAIGEGFFDGMRVKQCLLNLTTNAVKFTKDGTITLSARAVVHGGIDSLRFTIKDTGIGMSAKTVSKLFVPFVQADATTSMKFGGTGLGLVITRRLAEAMGGAVLVQSVEGEGSTFSFIIPRGPVERAISPTHTQNARAA
jgi:signal transduction histidine kinase